MPKYSVITGTGSYIPPNMVSNSAFLTNEFYSSDGTIIEKKNIEIINKFEEITTIAERRYVSDHFVTSDIAFFAALEAIKNSGINQEELDYVIVAHNFGDVKNENRLSDFVPCLAARVKFKLKIIVVR